jgi:hypothetical protein
MSETRSEIVWYLLVEVLLFAFAALAHGGVIMQGHENTRAAAMEPALAVILGGGVIMSFVSPAQTRVVALITQGLALVGVVAGIFMVAMGLEPRTLANLVVLAIMLITVTLGLIVAKRGMPA